MYKGTGELLMLPEREETRLQIGGNCREKKLTAALYCSLLLIRVETGEGGY